MVLLLPRLDEFTQTSWLIDGGAPSALGGVFVQTAIYVALLLAAAMFDFYRKNF